MSFDIDFHIRKEREALLAHPLFLSIQTVDDVRQLMETHVYAVWDFMSLLKRLQRDLTCVELPWSMPRYPSATRLINEIVTGEESDEKPGGGFASHLEIYLSAMHEIGADTTVFSGFAKSVSQGIPLSVAFRSSGVPEAARAFVTETMNVVQFGTLEDVLAYFFFGREDIIPDMFGRLLIAWSVPESSVPMLTYYLKRHIQMDGEEHGPAAKRIVMEIAREQHQRERLAASARDAINARVLLWDGVLEKLNLRRQRMPESAIHSAKYDRSYQAAGAAVQFQRSMNSAG